MIEIPESDQRQRQRAQFFGVLLIALGVQSVFAGGFYDAAGLAAVTRDTAGGTQFFEWNILLKYASTMESAAAPLSKASICSTTGVRTRFGAAITS